MKKIGLYLALSLIFNCAKAQAPAWSWAESGNGSNDDGGGSVCTDAWGNVYVTGSSNSNPVKFLPFSLANAGGYDIILVKYRPNGTVIWARSAGGTGDESGTSICTDPSGNVIITGEFTSPSLTIGTTTLINAGMTNIFTAKYDSAGNALWARGGGGPFYDEPYGVVTDAKGNVIIAGSYSSTNAVFGSDTLANYGSQNSFIVKYSSSGNLLWAKRSAWNNQTAGISALGIDHSGNLLITGNFTSAGASGNVGIDTIAVNGMFPISSSSNIFIAKLDTTGTALWATGTNPDANGSAIGSGITSDLNNNIFVTGKFGGAYIVYGNDTIYMPASSSLGNMFLVKFDPLGNALWTGTTAGASGGATGTSVCTDASGSSYVTGAINGLNISFGPVIAGYLPYGYVVKYSSTGTPVWVKGIDGGLGGTALTTDPANNIVVTGAYQTDTATFDSFKLLNACLGCNNSDLYVAKLGNLVTAINENKPGSKMNVYPNPASDFFTVSFGSEQQNTLLEILDVTGNRLRVVRFSGIDYKLERGHLPPGVYLIRVITTDEVLVRQIILQ